MLNNEYCKRVYEQILARDPDQKEFHQAVYEVLEGLESMVERRPELEKNGILERSWSGACCHLPGALD